MIEFEDLFKEEEVKEVQEETEEEDIFRPYKEREAQKCLIGLRKLTLWTSIWTLIVGMCLVIGLLWTQL